MEAGELDLKAWGVGIAPQAQLHFNDDLLLKNQYVPVVGLVSGGTTVPAHRCDACKLVCFEFEASVGS